MRKGRTHVVLALTSGCAVSSMNTLIIEKKAHRLSVKLLSTSYIRCKCVELCGGDDCIFGPQVEKIQPAEGSPRAEIALRMHEDAGSHS